MHSNLNQLTKVYKNEKEYKAIGKNLRVIFFLISTISNTNIMHTRTCEVKAMVERNDT